MPYSIGIDYGTESGRVLLLDLESGQELGVAVVPYSNGVIDTVLPSTGEKLPPDFALQDPEDYIRVLHQGIPEVLEKSGVGANQIISLGIDFTSCTVLPVTEDGTPLCMLPQWRGRKHAWTKLWKHHAAQDVADRINEAASARGEAFLTRYGGRISSEWYFPKLIEVFEEDREVYDACYAFIEATDYVIWYLTGVERRNSCTAGYKAMWAPEEGIPDTEIFRAVSPEFVQPGEKLGNSFYPLGTKAGFVRDEIAKELGLPPQVAVAVGNVDAHVSVPGAGVSSTGTLVMVMGTSICHLTTTENEVRLPGITGVVKDGVLPGLYGYEAGQAAVGDMFAWFVKKLVPDAHFDAAKDANKDIYQYLEEAASQIDAGETGLVALDWWNGNRSILGDADLTGCILGLTLSTKPEEIYRALLESTAFGTRRIVENFSVHGVPITELVACGGIAHKSPLLMQIYADVCGIPVVVRSSSEIPARGSALFGAVAAGRVAGGFASIEEASTALAPELHATYTPNPEAHAVYNDVYHIYRELYAYLGQENTGLMHGLKRIRVRQFERRNTQ